LRQAQDAKRTDWPERIEGPLPADQAHLLKGVRNLIAQAAESVGIPVEIVARRKDLEAWLRSGSRDGQYAIPESLSGWRKPLVVEPVQQYLNAQWEAVNEA
jgi:ribonuclease D